MEEVERRGGAGTEVTGRGRLMADVEEVGGLRGSSRSAKALPSAKPLKH